MRKGKTNTCKFFFFFFFYAPFPNSVTHSCFKVGLIDVTLACEDANSIHVEVVNVDAEKRVAIVWCTFGS